MEKIVRFISVLCLGILFFSCGVKEVRSSDGGFNAFEIKYVDIVLGKTAVGLEASIVLISHRTDMASPQYARYSWENYIKDFNRLYPGIKVSVEALTDYSSNATAMLEHGNRGDIATMALGSWVFTQIQGAGPNPDDIGYMPFPMEVDGVQIATVRPDNNFGINVRSSATKKLAAMIFVKWMVEQSGFQYKEGEIPVLLSEEMIADVYRTFDGLEIMADAPPFSGEENLLTVLNADSGLLINQNGERKLRQLVEHAAAGDVSFDQLMEGLERALGLGPEKERHIHQLA